MKVRLLPLADCVFLMITMMMMMPLMIDGFDIAIKKGLEARS